MKSVEFSVSSFSKIGVRSNLPDLGSSLTARYVSPSMVYVV